jgi:hypothetical protein
VSVLEINYLGEINSFHDWLITNPVPTTARVLWFALMHYCNRTGWRTEFNLAISALELDTGLSKQAIIRARNALQQAGRIKVTVRKGNQAALYQIIPFAFLKETQIDTQSDTCVIHKSNAKCRLDDTQSDTIPKLNINKTKTEKEKEKKEKTPRDVIAQFAGDNAELKASLTGWMEMRTRIRKPLTTRATELALKRLNTLAQGDQDLMAAIADQSTMNSWQGFFPLKGASVRQSGGIEGALNQARKATENLGERNYADWIAEVEDADG